MDHSTNRIQSLLDQGQSIWLDYIDRRLMYSGKLADLVKAGLHGVTSNPTIFHKAISSSDDYDADLQRLAQSDDEPADVFESLAIADIRQAADILRPVYDSADGHDGFVSLEVSPELAYDTEATIEEASRLWNAVNRPNLMVKVPATMEGIPAIRTLIGQGLNINVTLIFSLERYRKVMDAYMAGLEDRLANEMPVNRSASVASFFVSRVDSNVDEALDELIDSGSGEAAKANALKGAIAVANAKIAYREFQDVVANTRWQELASRGARVQRPLWASTSTKNPDYSELLYVESLIGPYTVNTMPPDTLEVLRKTGHIERTVDKDLEQAHRTLDQLSELGISLDEITDELEVEGVKKFDDSYQELKQTIAEKLSEFRGS